MNEATDTTSNIAATTEVSAVETTAVEAAISTASIPTRSGALPAHVAAPSENAITSASVIVVHDANGADDWTQRCASRLASLGFTAVVPDLFAQSTAPADDSEVARQDFLLALPDAKIVADLLAVVDWLVERGHLTIGIVGWGWGGAYALMAGAHDARLHAVVEVGGTVSYPVSTPNRLASPLNFVADLEGPLLAAYPGADPQFPLNEIERLRGRLLEHDKDGEIKIYPDAPPNFWHDEQSPHTLLLWRRVSAFLNDHLIEELDDNPAFGEGYPNEESRLHA